MNELPHPPPACGQRARTHARDLGGGDGDGRWLVWHATHATPASIHLPSSLRRPHFSSLRSSFFLTPASCTTTKFLFIGGVGSPVELVVPRASGASCGAVRPTTRRFHASQAHRIRFLFPSLLRPAAAGSFLLKQISSCAEARPGSQHRRHVPTDTRPPSDHPPRRPRSTGNPTSRWAPTSEPSPSGCARHVEADREMCEFPAGTDAFRCPNLATNPPHLPWNPGLIPSR
jgi:hypothetical protein